MAKRLQVMGNFGSPTDAQIATAVEEYMTANPVDVPTEEEINALIDAKLSNFTNVAEVGA